jgi:hypothetical protein
MFRYVSRRLVAYLVITLVVIALGAVFGHPRHF